MPLYAFSCPACGARRDEFRHIDERHDGPACCGKTMALVICAPHVAPDLPGYESPTTGRWIEGRAARRDDLARSNARPWEGFAEESKEAARRRREFERRADVKLEDAARRAFHALPPAKRKALEGSE